MERISYCTTNAFFDWWRFWNLIEADNTCFSYYEIATPLPPQDSFAVMPLHGNNSFFRNDCRRKYIYSCSGNHLHKSCRHMVSGQHYLYQIDDGYIRQRSHWCTDNRSGKYDYQLHEWRKLRFLIGLERKGHQVDNGNMEFGKSCRSFSKQYK